MGRCGVALLVLTACGRFGFGNQSDGGGSGSGSDTALHVTIPTDRMAGPPTMSSLADLPPGTTGLALREALAIAANHAGPDRIDFDPTVFPAAAPQAIAIDSPLVVAGDGTTVDASAAGVEIAPNAAMSIEGVQITGGNAVVDGLAVQGGTVGVHVMGAPGVTLRSVVSRSAQAQGILVEQAMGGTVVDCRVEQAGPVAMTVTGSSDVTVQRAFVALAAKAGVLEGIRLEGSSRLHLLDSIVDPGTAWMVNVQDTSDSEVTGNIMDGGDTGITVFGTSARDTFFRNVWIAPAYHGIYLDTGVASHVVLNNTCYGCPAGSEVADSGTATQITNTLISTSASDFVAPATYDFHLAAGSLSIDQGQDVGQDMLPDSPARFLGAAPDLGAVETH